MPLDRQAWDAPTFYVCSDRIMDFRPHNVGYSGGEHLLVSNVIH